MDNDGKLVASAGLLSQEVLQEIISETDTLHVERKEKKLCFSKKLCLL
jgi:hypothetical protein